MKIPTSFKLFGQTINVRIVGDLMANRNLTGLAKFRNNEIEVQGKNTSQPKELIEQTFIHELVHWVLFHAGEDSFDPPLHEREYLVDRVAMLLHQALTTMRYDYEVEIIQDKVAAQKSTESQELMRYRLPKEAK